MKDENYIFSKELRETMAKFGEMEVKDALASPDFFIELMNHSGFTIEEAKEIFIKVGRPDIAELLEEE